MSTTEEIQVDLLEAKDNLEKAKEALAKLGSDTSSLAFRVAEAKVNMLKVEVSLLKTGLVLAEAEAVLSQNDTPETREKVSDAKAKVTMLESRYDIFAKAFAAALLKASTAAAPITDEVQRKRALESVAGELSTGGKRLRGVAPSSLEAFYESLDLFAYTEPFLLDLEFRRHAWPMLDRQDTANSIFRAWIDRIRALFSLVRTHQASLEAAGNGTSGPRTETLNMNGILDAAGIRQNMINQHLHLSKNDAPIITVSGGPGSGKSRFLDCLANPAKRTELVDIFQHGQKLMSGGTLSPDLAESIKLMREAVGISVTFNQSTSDVGPFANNPCKGLAARILWSCSDRGDWGTFLEKVPQDITLQSVLQRIFQHVGDKYVILCIDELLTGCSTGDQLDMTKFRKFIADFGAALENFPRILHTMSTVGYKSILESQNWSGRTVRQCILSPLSVRSVKKLCKDAMEDKISAQVIEDAYGCPRLVYHAHKAIDENVSRESMHVLRNIIANQNPIYKLTVIDKHLLIALRTALSGHLVNMKESLEVDEAVIRGFLYKNKKSIETEESVHIEERDQAEEIARTEEILPVNQEQYWPVMPPLLIACLCAKIKFASEMSPLAKHLLILCNSFLSYDQHNEADFNPKTFENQICILFQIRCALLPSSVDGEDLVAGSMSRTTFQKLLTPGCKSQLPIVWGTLAKEVVEVPVYLNRKTFKDSALARFELDSITPEHVCVAERENFEGIDLLLEAPMVNKDRINLVVGIQVKYGKVDANSLDVNTIANAIINTSTHKALEKSIDEGRFLFVAAVCKDVVRALSDSNALINAIKERGLPPDELTRPLKIAENVIILDCEVLRELFTPSLNSRLHLKTK